VLVVIAKRHGKTIYFDAESLLEWWAEALDQQAQLAPEAERPSPV
jgi:hypothetical protein